MLLFSRSRTARPDRFRDALESSVAIGDKVTQITGLDISVWNTRFGAPVGTISWSCRLDSQAELMDATEKLQVDAGYTDMAMSISELFEGQVEDFLGRLVSGTPADTPKKYYTTAQATMRGGKTRDAIAFGADMQQFVSDGMGAPGIFVAAEYGPFARVAWLFGFDTMADVDAASEWTATNEEYHARIDAADPLFVEQSGVQGLIERIN